MTLQTGTATGVMYNPTISEWELHLYLVGAHFARVIWAFMDSEGWTLSFLEFLDGCHSQLPSYRNNWEELQLLMFRCSWDIHLGLGGGFKYFLKVHLYMGKIRILTNIVFSWVDTTNQYKFLSFRILTPPTGCLVVSPISAAISDLESHECPWTFFLGGGNSIEGGLRERGGY